VIGSLQWSSQCRYMGVYFVSGRAFRNLDALLINVSAGIIELLMRCSVKLDDLRLKKSF